MPIDVYTGQPGNGKTALMMERLLAESSKAERPIFAAGIDGLAPGLATILDDAKDWNAIDPNQAGTCLCRKAEGAHAHIVPDGSIIFVDEAWRFFGHLQDATRQATPKHVLELAEHRHRGLDFVWTTQMPNQLFPFTRGLIAAHHHVVRRFGTQFIDVFSWGELNEDVKSPAKREAATRDTRTLPTASFDKYKSATLHTIKRKLPIKVLLLPVVIIAVLVIGFFAWRALQPENMMEGIVENAPGGGVAADGAPTGAPTKPPAIRTAAEYAAAHTALIPGQPWTAPAYLGRSITVNPIVICMASGAGEDGDGKRSPGGCRCMTEQATEYAMPEPQCRTIARKGPAYNPYKQESSQGRQDDQEGRPGAGQRPAGTARGAGAGDPPGALNGDDPYQTRYGQFRGTTPSADPAFGG